jgi:proline iminopeptidase
VYFDTRHSGRSTGPEDPTQYGLDHLVSDIDALRVHIGADRVFVAGHSGGGHQVLEYGIQHGDHLLGIIAIDAIVAADEVWSAERARRIAAKEHEPFYRANPDYYAGAVAIGRFGDRRPTIAEVFAARGAFYYHDPEKGIAAYAAGMDYDDQLNAYSRASGFQSKNLLPDLHRITVPTLLVYGDDDFQCDPVTQGKRAHDVMPTSRLAVIPEAGHRPWVEQPASFAAACTAWLAEIVG